MSDSRFTPQNKTTNERLSTTTVGLVALSDFRKRRAEVIEQQEREAREAQATSTPPERSRTGTPAAAGDGSEAERQAKKRKKKKAFKASGATKLSFAGEEEEGDADEDLRSGVSKPRARQPSSEKDGSDNEGEASTSGGDKSGKKPAAKIAANAAVGVVPKALTKAALRREAAEREALRKEFLALQAAVRATDVAIPFVFYDGTNIPGGIVRVKKGDFIWVFLDKARKVGAQLAGGDSKNTRMRREWARVGVDDLMMVRGTIIIPHHYEFYFFVMNKSIGPGGQRLFDYSAEAPMTKQSEIEEAEGEDEDGAQASPNNNNAANPLSVPKKSAAAQAKNLPDIRTLEGHADDPTFTKVVDRRWYERNKHIYPASVWQEFDPEKDYSNQIRRDPGGNAFFFAK